MLYEVITKVISVPVDVGQPEDDLIEPEEKAKKFGVLKHYTIDAKEEFAKDYIFRAIKANALYEGYPLSTRITSYNVCYTKLCRNNFV